jgi:hypothetical protein
MSEADQPEKRSGFDAPARRRDQDHLNRWPFAREIYMAAISGPKDWSVRIGLYGEWGTGKTSVLEFVSAMANKHDHVVVWFDPWEYSSKAVLWREFVLKIFRALEDKVGGVVQAGDARRKALLNKVSGTVKSIGASLVGALNESAGKVTDAGLHFVKDHFAFGPDDLRSLSEVLGERRIIVLIDDLDRTAAELVPEILFTLKQLMDVPGFSFVCAFDPLVVGQVLAKDHPGFGDGLKFLEKVIDYPRWLPSAPANSLVELALHEAKIHCPFVPDPALRDAVPLLPPNPRAVRQFIRLIAMIRPQIDRHHADELQWPVVLAANILKVRYPQLADPLLRNDAFWESWRHATFGSKKTNDEENRAKLINGHVAAVAKIQAVVLSEKEQDEVFRILDNLCASAGWRLVLYPTTFSYQLEIAEAPAAVTGKEFDEFLQVWKDSQNGITVENWIAEHGKSVERSDVSIYRDLLKAAITRYADVLNRANAAIAEPKKKGLAAAAGSLFALIKSLVLEVGGLANAERKLGREELAALFETFARIANSFVALSTDFHSRNETLLTELLTRWTGDTSPLVDELKPHYGFGTRHFERGAARDLYQKLCSILWPKLAKEVLDSFNIPGFVTRALNDENRSGPEMQLILDVKGHLWKGLRAEILALLRSAAEKPNVQENAFALLRYFDDSLETLGKNGRIELLDDGEIALALWDAATAVPLTPYAVVRLCEVASYIQKGGSMKFPHWWDEALKLSGYDPKGQEKSPAEAEQLSSEVPQQSPDFSITLQPGSGERAEDAGQSGVKPEPGVKP